MQLVTIKEAVELRRISRSTINRLITDGTLTRYKLGRLTRVDMEQLDAAFTAQTNEQAS